MPTSRRSVLLLATVALLAGACGGSPAVEVEAEPAGAGEPVTVEREVDRVSGPRRTGDRPAVPVRDSVPEPDPAPTPTEPAPPPAPPAPASPPPAPAPAPADEPDLVVGEDGCVTDRDLGIVITCHDPAAGPD